MSCYAYQITELDIENVLSDYSHRVANSRGMSFEQMASELITEVDAKRVEHAALQGGEELDGQTVAAMEEIRVILEEIGVLEEC